jgi:hypothetical protein
MLDVSPSSLVFRDVRLKQAYSTSLCISNQLNASVEFTIRTSSPRYSVTPSNLTLHAGQSVVVTVRLFLSSFPNQSRGATGQDDFILIKSSYFDQKVKTTLFLNNNTPTSTAASSSSSLGPAPIPTINTTTTTPSPKHSPLQS